ncbi:muconate/chloromuconate family cycloisomerase [Noviherbaspirillum sp. CPCC 100848]|uniref:Muconate/chloromuconate family cycloisomerase n=1 Tax=Noviherbaspirillum album TaxID=3080276 RepID=A0ABU6JEL3_9BURK|nr:muconate/chloromuconate family cycloisomerase [Noviherbaspirillum sp. CPCC 100848]MEC4722087.1 muconate/chloromuconate family cycloisomerase [Noviherbaspirillum sp. CPCC 100848]
MSNNHDQACIASIEAIIVDLPTIREHRLAMTTMSRQTLVIVRLRCDDGIEGVGEATTIGGLSYGEQSPESIKLALDRYISPLVIGMSAASANAVLAKVDQSVQGNSLAKSALETALLDAQGKRLGVPVHALLGGAVRNSLPVLWTLASGDSARDIDEARQLLDVRRHKVFKLKIGKRSPRADIEHVAAIKSALGDLVEITVDLNQAWSEAVAARHIPDLQAAGVMLVEQPIAKENRRGLARLAQRFIVPIMADEAVSTPADMFDYACEGAAGIVALKIAKSGGPLGVMRTAAVADAAGVGCYGGTMLEGTIGSIASAHAFAACRTMEWGTELFGPLLLKDDIVVERAAVADFELAVPMAPGLGVAIDEDKLAFYRRDQ